MSLSASFAASSKAWRCPQCAVRSFSTSLTRSSVGPEHPRYIAVREPPQQDLPDNTPVKGHLPIPRDVFNRAEGEDKASDEWIQRATPVTQHAKEYEPGTRAAWKAEMSEMRRQNMRQGLKTLRQRKDRFESKLRANASRKQQERETLLRQPARPDEMLAIPDHGIDFEKLQGKLSDKTRKALMQHKRQNVELHTEWTQQARLSALKELYLNARTFIITPEQLDNAIEEAFGTDEEPVTFGKGRNEGLSIWAEGVPQNVQEMLQQVNARGSRSISNRSSDQDDSIEHERITRIAEVLTGSTMAVPEPTKRAEPVEPVELDTPSDELSSQA